MALIQGSGAFTPSQPYLSTTEPPRPCRRPRPPSVGQRLWTEAETERLVSLWFGLVHPIAIGWTLGRTLSSVASAANRAGLPSRYGLPLVSEAPGPEAAERNRLKFWPKLRKQRCSLTGGFFYTDAPGARIKPCAKKQRAYLSFASAA